MMVLPGNLSPWEVEANLGYRVGPCYLLLSRQRDTEGSGRYKGQTKMGLCPVSFLYALYCRIELTWGELKLPVHRTATRENFTK